MAKTKAAKVEKAAAKQEKGEKFFVTVARQAWVSQIIEVTATDKDAAKAKALKVAKKLPDRREAGWAFDGFFDSPIDTPFVVPAKKKACAGGT